MYTISCPGKMRKGSGSNVVDSNIHDLGMVISKRNSGRQDEATRWYQPVNQMMCELFSCIVRNKDFDQMIDGKKANPLF